MIGQPDLKKLAVAVAKLLDVPDAGVERLRACPEHALSLTMLRVVMSELRRRKIVTPAQEDALIASAIPPVDPVAAMTPVGDQSRVSATSTVEQMIRDVDIALASPILNRRFPAWFINDFWPGLMKRVASGDKMNEREQAILRGILEGVR